MKRREREENKIQAKKVAQYNWSPPTDGCPAHPTAVIVPFQPTLPVYVLSVAFHGMEWPFGQCLLAMLLPSFLCTSVLAEHGKLKSP